ncbi:DHA2 family efflux MFS transporter permease subunit [Kribbella sp. NBC_00709]|uniref:DHA2 family efflux MFS transporter permease subunit n=1 Tax=Kribbella sp. NBC_00709 TaxID=2975972 RepID=UPI002E2D8304|nr:DHA2 family efflux MFS transporter permease subunit [Kribbella sp. NBC_00709]
MSVQTDRAETRGGPTPLDPALLRLGGVLSLAAVLAGLDATVVSVGIDAVAHDLGGPLSDLQWVSTGYLLAISIVMPLSGWASERFGAKAMWLTSVALFVAGSVLCGFAWSVPALISFRVVQGIGGGMMQPIGQSILAQAAGPDQLARIVGVLVMPVLFAPVIGPVLGGVIVQGLDWRWMFFVNVPIGLLTLLIALRVVPKDRSGPRGQARLDRLGLGLLSPGLAAVVFGLSAIGEHGAGSPFAIVPLASSVLLLCGYVVHALSTKETPLIDVRLFARRRFTAATTNSFLLGATLYGSMLILPLYFQQVEHKGAIEAGFSLAPQALGAAAISYFAGRLTTRIGPRAVILVGIGLSLAGTLPLVGLGSGLPRWVMLVALAVRGVGIGATMAPGMAAVYGSVERHQVPRAASALNVMNRIGGSIGTAALALILQAELDQQPSNPAVAYGHTFAWALALSVLPLLPALAFPGRNQK